MWWLRAATVSRSARVFLAFVFLVATVAASPVATVPVGAATESVYSQPALEAAALQSLRDGYALLVDPGASSRALVSTVSEHGTALTGDDRRQEIERFRVGNLQYGLRFIRMDVSLLDANVERRGETLVLIATEDLVMYYVVRDRPHGPNDWQGQRLRHEFVFEREGDGWRLSHDNALWGPQGRDTKGSDPNPLDRPGRLADAGATRLTAPGGPKQMRAPMPASGTYNASAAASYAQTYAEAYNTAYVDISGNDCTNFTSQALRAGGWVDAGGLYFDSYAWWYNASHQYTWTWSAAANQRQHVAYSGRGYSLSAFTDLIVGDLMWADWNYPSDPDIDHSMIVTQKFSNDYGDIKFSYHDTDRLNWSLASILASNPTSSNLYYGMRIQYTNP